MDLPFRNPLVRDLAWAIGSPDVLRPSKTLPCFLPELHQKELVLAWEKLSFLDQEPSELQNFVLQGHRKKLGLYFEDLIRFWIDKHDQFQLIAHDLQIYHQNKTLGALDFLVKSQTGFEHWEIAVKFYLGYSGKGAWSQWIGMNKRDRLASKVTKMRDKQLTLSDHPSVKSYLHKLGIKRPVNKRLMLKGMFFAPWQLPELRPHRANQSKGIWCFQHQLEDFMRTQPEDSNWIPRISPDWLAPLHHTHQRNENSLQQVINLHGIPLMISQLHNGKEINRVIVIPNNWWDTTT